MTMARAVLAAAVLAVAAAASKYVEELTPETIGPAIANSDRPLLLKFYAPWCGHCQHLAPKFSAAAKDPVVQQRARFADVNCEDHKPLCQVFGVEGYPAVLFVPPSKADIDVVVASARRFSGQRTTEGIKDFVLRMTRPPVARLTCVREEASEGDNIVFAGNTGSSGKGSGSGSGGGPWDLHAWARETGRDGIAFLHVGVPSSSEDDDASGTAGAVVSKALAATSTKLQDTTSFASIPLAALVKTAEGAVAGSSSEGGGACSKKVASALRPLAEALAIGGGVSGPVASAIAAAGGLFIRVESPLAEAASITVPKGKGSGAVVAGIHIGNATGALPGRLEIALPVVGDCPAAHAAAATSFSALVASEAARYRAAHGKQQQQAEGGGGGGGAGHLVGVTPIILSADGSDSPATAAPAAAAPPPCTTGDRSTRALLDTTGIGAPQSLHAWVDRMRFRVVSPIGLENFPALANNAGKAYLAIAIVHAGQVPHPLEEDDRYPSPSARLLASLSLVAHRHTTPLSPSVRERFLFGWLDAATYDNFVEQFNISPSSAPQLLVVDSPTKRYWHDPSVGIEPEDIETYLQEIASGVAPVQRQGMMAYPQRIINAVGLVPAVGIAAAAALGLLYCLWRLIFADLCGGGSSSGEGDEDAASSSGSGKRKHRSAAEDFKAQRIDAKPPAGAKKQAQTQQQPSPAPAAAEAAAAASAASAASLDADEDGEVFQRVEEEAFDSDNEAAAAAAAERSARQGYTRSFRLQPHERPARGEDSDEGEGGSSSRRKTANQASSWRARLAPAVSASTASAAAAAVTAGEVGAADAAAAAAPSGAASGSSTVRSRPAARSRQVVN